MTQTVQVVDIPDTAPKAELPNGNVVGLDCNTFDGILGSFFDIIIGEQVDGKGSYYAQDIDQSAFPENQDEFLVFADLLIASGAPASAFMPDKKAAVVAWLNSTTDFDTAADSIRAAIKVLLARVNSDFAQVYPPHGPQAKPNTPTALIRYALKRDCKIQVNPSDGTVKAVVPY